MAFPWEAVGAVASLAGSGLSFIGGQNALAANQSQNAFQNQLATQQLQFERDAAQHGISWRVDDAKAAGISPLVALGAPTFNPGAIQVGGGNYDNPFAGAGSGLVAMGQDISRAAMVAQTERTRMETLKAIEDAKNNSALTASQVDKNMADAALARRYAEVAGMPRMPSVSASSHGLAGQGSVTEVVPSDAGATKLDPNYQWRKIDATHWQKTPPPSLESSSSVFNPEYLMWAYRNRLARQPASSGPPMESLPDGAVRWKNNGGGVWEATPYYEWERH